MIDAVISELFSCKMMKTWDNQKWHDHLNNNWMKERFDTVSTRGGLQFLYLRLLENKVQFQRVVKL